MKVKLTGEILDELVKNSEAKSEIQTKLKRIFESENLDELEKLFKSFFASIPYEWYRKNVLAGYYASVFYAYFTATGFEVKVEDATSSGKVDMTVLFPPLQPKKVFVFEFKVIKDEGKALKQIKEKRYWEKYRNVTDKIFIVGVEFDPNEKNIVRFEWEKIKTA